MYDHKWTERYEHYFENHEVLLHESFSAKDTHGTTHTLEHLVYKEPGTGFYRMEYIMKGGTLFVSGDCGDAVYWWSERQSLEWVSKCDIGYFKSKCRASEVGYDFVEWDEKHAIRRVEEELEQLDEERQRRFKKWGGLKHLGYRAEWADWLDQVARGVDEGTKGEYFFGPDYLTDGEVNIGYVTHVRCEIHLAALKFAMRKKEHEQRRRELRPVP